MTNDWKYPSKDEMPPLDTLVLCFTGGARFGAYELGALSDSAEGVFWIMEGREADYIKPNAWQLLPGAPEFI